MSNNNPTGVNGHGAKNCLSFNFFHLRTSWLLTFKDPDDETLKAALFQYAKEQLGTDQHLARLEAKHNLSIKYVVIYTSSICDCNYKLYQGTNII